jgi:hypothetical protein
MAEKICEICKQTFNSLNKNARFCGRACSGKNLSIVTAAKKTRIKRCKLCGVELKYDQKYVGFCSRKCWAEGKKITDKPIYLDRIRSKILNNIIKDEKGCWNWSKSKSKSGYGAIHFRDQKMRAHRVSYLVFVGEVPLGQLVCHKCANPLCVNPEHLFLGTHKDNSRDMVNKKRVPRGTGAGLSKLNE